MLSVQVISLFMYICIVSEAYSDGRVTNNNIQNARNKRLLFYDEEGNLVKTFTNPYFSEFFMNPERYPFFGNFFKPFQNFLQPTKPGPVSYMIPVSDDVVQQINKDPVYQNKVLLKEPTIEPNLLCSGKRTQIPSPNSCSNFLNCWDGWAFEQECPDGLSFSDKGFCDYPYRVDCGNRRLNGAARCSKDFEVFRNEAKCSEFFICMNRLPVRFVCPEDLSYNEALGVCDYPYRVNCSGSLAADGSPPLAPPGPSSSTPSAPAYAATTPHPSDTKMMMDTDSGSAHVAVSRQDAIHRLNVAQLARVARDQ